MKKFFEGLVKLRIPLIALAILAAAAFPFIASNQYTLRIGTIALMYVMLALSLNLLTGFMGVMSFGHAAFWGIGAYTAALLTTHTNLGSGTAFILSALVAGMFGLLLGLPVLKLRGAYLTIVTMGFCEIVRIVEINWTAVTRGPLGISGIPRPSFFGFQISSPRGMYFLILIMVILTTIIVKNIVDSRIGTGIKAIRDDDLAAEAMGVPIFRYKVMVFVLSAMLAGVAGAFYAQYVSYIDPTSFTSSASMEMLVMVIFGGLGSIVGSIFGALSFSILPEMLRGLMEYRMLLYGVAIVLLMQIKPDGILGNVNFKYIKQRMLAYKDGGSKDGKYTEG